METQDGWDGAAAMKYLFAPWSMTMLAVMVLVLSVVGYFLTVNPRVLAMNDCTRGLPNAEKQVACAEAIFGGQTND